MKYSSPTNLPSFLRTALPAVALAVLATSNTSNAAVIASWDTWTDSAALTYNADAELAGFQATIATTDPNDRANSGGFGSTDGNFGSLLSGAVTTDNTALLVRSGNPPIDGPKGWNVVTISITNGTGFSYNLESIHFDIGVRSSSGDSYTLEYTSGGLGPAITSLGSATGITNIGDQGNADDFDIDLTSSSLSDITLGTGESAVFTLTIDSYVSVSASSTLDNVAIQGSAIPEPSSAALLGLGGLALILRRRK